MKKIPWILIALFALAVVQLTTQCKPKEKDLTSGEGMMDDSTRHLVTLVTDAARLVQDKGEAAFDAFRETGSRWQQGETYIFVLDTFGNMLVHPDATLAGKNQIGLKDINGKPIIRGLIDAATTVAGKLDGWYHYEWPVPGGLLPRWKSSYVRQVQDDSGKIYIVGCGVYDDRMQQAFVIDMVQQAVEQIQEKGEAAYPMFRDPTGPFIAKDAYVFVIDNKGVELVNAGFPSLEGRNIMELKDAQGKFLSREMFSMVEKNGTGWVDYMWPKPGESVPTVKSTYVTRATIGDQWVLVGCGVYLDDAPKAEKVADKMTASQLMQLVREAAVVFENEGENAYPAFREKGSKWFRDGTYFFVWSLDGKRVFHAADPTIEGRQVSDLTDVKGRPFGRMFLESAATPSGEGWVHYMYPEPGDIFPTWKSSFLKRVAYPSGKKYLIGCGIYNMDMDKAFIEDVVNRASELVADKGPAAFDQLRDKKGPFVFMDTYVFVDDLAGVELVNGMHPSLEGKNLIDEKDANGKLAMKEYLDAATKKGSAWVEYYWYRPGTNEVAVKHSFVRLVKHGTEQFVVGAGMFEKEGIVI